MEKKHSDINAKYNKLLEENEEMREKINKLSSNTSTVATTPVAATTTSVAATTTSVKKETRSSTNVQNNQNTCSMKTRGVRVALVKN